MILHTYQIYSFKEEKNIGIFTFNDSIIYSSDFIKNLELFKRYINNNTRILKDIMINEVTIESDDINIKDMLKILFGKRYINNYMEYNLIKEKETVEDCKFVLNKKFAFLYHILIDTMLLYIDYMDKYDYINIKSAYYNKKDNRKFYCYALTNNRADLGELYIDNIYNCNIYDSTIKELACIFAESKIYFKNSGIKPIKYNHMNINYTKLNIYKKEANNKNNTFIGVMYIKTSRINNIGSFITDINNNSNYYISIKEIIEFNNITDFNYNSNMKETKYDNSSNSNITIYTIVDNIYKDRMAFFIINEDHDNNLANRLDSFANGINDLYLYGCTMHKLHMNAEDDIDYFKTIFENNYINKYSFYNINPVDENYEKRNDINIKAMLIINKKYNISIKSIFYQKIAGLDKYGIDLYLENIKKKNKEKNKFITYDIMIKNKKSKHNLFAGNLYLLDNKESYYNLFNNKFIGMIFKPQTESFIINYKNIINYAAINIYDNNEFIGYINILTNDIPFLENCDDRNNRFVNMLNYNYRNVLHFESRKEYKYNV